MSSRWFHSGHSVLIGLVGHCVLTLGRAWTSDYGDPHDPHDFDFIYPISPLHNIPTDKVLPPLMLTTADRASSPSLLCGPC